MAIWNILQTFGILYDHLIHFVFIWYIFSVSLIFTKKNLATLLSQPKKSRRRTGTMLQTSDQGDQIGRISANRAIVYFWTVFLKKIKKQPKSLDYFFQRKSCINFDKKKNSSAAFWALCFTNSSGHPAPIPDKDKESILKE
jgi:hypothetical protein